MKAVQKALAAGRITKAGDKIDSEQADAAWEANTDTAKRRQGNGNGHQTGSAAPGSYLHERTEREKLRRQREQMEFERESGELVRRADVLGGFEALVTRTRSKLLGIPSKCKQQIPHLSNKDVLIIDNIVREALLELANVDDTD